jgi:hypothetical protein
MATPALTPSQERVLAFVRGFVRERGFPPNHAEIAHPSRRR